MFYSIQFSDEFLFTTYTSNPYRSNPMYRTGFDMLVVLNQHAMQTSTISNQLVYWVDKLVDVYGLMHWRVGWCVESTCWLTFTNWCIDLFVGCWIDMLVDVYWCTNVFVGVLYWHVCWRLLIYWRVGWFVESTCWLMFTGALTCWLLCWIDMLFALFCSMQLLRTNCCIWL